MRMIQTIKKCFYHLLTGLLLLLSMGFCVPAYGAEYDRNVGTQEDAAEGSVSIREEAGKASTLVTAVIEAPEVTSAPEEPGVVVTPGGETNVNDNSTSDSSRPDNVKTGDERQPTAYIILIGAAGLGVLLTVFLRSARQK